MSFQWIRAAALSLSVTALAAVAAPSPALAQQALSSPTLLPVPANGPQLTGYPAYPTTGTRAWSVSQPQPPQPPMEGAPAPQAASATESGGEGCNDGGCQAGCRGWLSRWTGGCGCDVGCCPNWYASAAGLIMARDRGNGIVVTNDGTPFNTVINSRDVLRDWQGGWEVTLGRRFGADTALEATYWGTGLMHASDTQIATAQASGALNTPINFGTLNDGVNNVQDLYDTTAGAHMFGRANEFMNIEINLIHDSCCCGRPAIDACSCCRPYCYSWFAGVRFFRFYENILVATSDNNTDFVFDVNEAYYDVRVHNNLIGPQIGGRFEYYSFGGKLGMYIAPSVGIYGNHISHQSFLRTGNGELFNIQSYKNDVAVLGEIKVGADYFINDAWKVFAGYRLVGAAGVALSDNQIPQRVDDFAAIDSIDSNGSVLLHGIFAGVEYRW